MGRIPSRGKRFIQPLGKTMSRVRELLPHGRGRQEIDQG